VISFIVPTLWKSEKIHESKTQFLEADIPNSEFIVIDNAASDKNIVTVGKIITVETGHNIGVNPAWNLGVEIAKNNLICLLNDDITFNFKTLKNNLTSLEVSSAECFVGFDANENFSDTLNEDFDKFHFKKATCRTLGFGCMMIFSKKNYIHIDERMKIFCGDDLLYWWNKDKHDRTIYTITNLKATGDLSVTSKSYEEQHMQHDVDIFQEVVRNLQ
jgi:hypothetical protein